MIERFFEYLIQKLYWEFRKENNLPFGNLKNEPVIKFGGFVLEEPYWNKAKECVEVRRGWHTREPLLKMGDIPVYTQTIYLNKLFLHKQMGLQVFFESKEEFFKHFNKLQKYHIHIQKNHCCSNCNFYFKLDFLNNISFFFLLISMLINITIKSVS